MDPSGAVLVIEDDPDIGRLISIHLSDMGFVVECVGDGSAGLEKALRGSYQLLLLDVMLPGKDGIEICKTIRQKNASLPILMLTSRGSVADRVTGLEAGADDYLTKPFQIEELIARVKALLRRASPALQGATDTSAERLCVGDLTIDFVRRKVLRGREEIAVTAKEYELLSFLAASPGRAYSRDELLKHVWDYHSEGYRHVIDTHVNRLRAKLELDPANPRYVLTVWGVGYRLAEPEKQQ